MTTRTVRFLFVGGMGFSVQMCVATLLLVAGVHPLACTLLAIEAAIVHNHAWHRRWAWRDRAGVRTWPETLWRAHVGSGASSLLVGLSTVALLGAWLSPLVAQVVAVATCAAANYWLADRWVFGRPRALTVAALLIMLATTTGTARASGPSPEAIASWDRYARALEAVRASEASRGVPAWATDEDRDGRKGFPALRRGDVVVTRRTLPSVRVEDATLEHWQGSLLLRGVSLEQVSSRLRNPDRYPQPPDVLALTVSARGAESHDIYLRLRRSLLVTATYDTWHHVRHVARGASRLDSVSLSSRIEEVEDAGTASERRLAADQSRGFLWRMRSAWRFTAVPEGVVVTCESLTLSRPVPFGLGMMARPIITRVARESMTTAVRAWQRGWPG